MNNTLKITAKVDGHTHGESNSCCYNVTRAQGNISSRKSRTEIHDVYIEFTNTTVLNNRYTSQPPTSQYSFFHVWWETKKSEWPHVVIIWINHQNGQNMFGKSGQLVFSYMKNSSCSRVQFIFCQQRHDSPQVEWYSNKSLSTCSLLILFTKVKISYFPSKT